MGAGKTAGTGWRQVPVLIRSDIIAAAEREHLDISEECTRALAKRLGIDLQPPRRIRSPGESQVIVAPDAVPAGRAASTLTTPAVINAEDPTVPGKVLREKKERKAHAATKLQASPEEPALPHPGAPVLPPALPGPAPKTRRKGKKEDAIKRFVSTRIVRETEESPDAIIAKDELYQRFERWCRDHDYAAIPDRRVFFVTLKNKYALAERSVAGVPSWISIRLK
jgi:hypothetical protein